jgi:hypothetical protein
VVVIEIVQSGRTAAHKHALYRALADRLYDLRYVTTI